jgi:hypothetical protein
MTTPVQRASTAGHFRVTATVDGINLGVFDTFTGGNVSAEVSKRRAGGAKSRRATLGGPRDVDDVTIAREFVHQRDHALAAQLEQRTGSAEAVVTRQPLDANQAPYGRPKTYAGILQNVAYPDADSDSADTAMLELTFVVEDVA